jgi:hypothetical protein
VDSLLRQSERIARALPGDRRTALAHARELARAGRLEPAREVIHSSLTSRTIDSEMLALVRDMALRTAHAGQPAPHPAPHTQIDLVVRGSIAGRHKLAEVVPTVAFLGAPDAWRSVQRLLELFSSAGPQPRACELVRSYVAWGGERVIEFRVPLRVGWLVSPGYEARSLRVLNLPGAAASTKFRRRLMRSASAFAVVVDPEADDDAVVLGVRELAADLRRAGGHSLDGFPLLLQYASAEEADRHGALTAALGLPAAAWTIAAPDADAAPVETLALLLLELGRGVQNLVRPRGTA